MLWPFWVRSLFIGAGVVLLILIHLALDPANCGRAPFLFYLSGLFLIALAVRRSAYIITAALALVATDLLPSGGGSLLLGHVEGGRGLAVYAVGAVLVPFAASPIRAARARRAGGEELIRQSEQSFRLAIAHSQVTLYTTDRDMRATWIYNPHPPFTPENVIGKHVGELLPDGGGDEVLALQREVLDTGRPVRRTVTTRFPGERIIYDIFAEPLLDPAGNIIGIAAAACDITSTIEIREQLKTAHEEMSRLWRQCAMACEAGRMGEWSWKVSADRVNLSRSMCRVMGLAEPASDSSTLSLDDILHVIHPDDRHRIRSAARRAVEDGRDFEIEVRVLDGMPNGPGVRWVEMRGQLERDSADQPDEIIGVALDVTARHLTEDALARHNASLLRSNEDLEDFAYIVSHDLKEPLRGISNFARFVLEDDGPEVSEVGRNRLETIHRLTDRLAAQLDSLVQFSRVGRAEMGIEDCSLEDVATAAAQRLGPWLDERNAAVTIEPGMPRTRCDRVRLEEVFVNLISNAVKYNDSDQKHVRIGIGPDGAIYVQDNGIGIPARNTSDIFQMFRRLHGRDAYEGGTGAGLAITRKIIERHAGRIWVDSEPGHGSKFCFTLGVAQPTNLVTTEPCAGVQTCCQS